MDIQGFDQRMTAVVGSVAGVRNHDKFGLKERLGKSKIHLLGQNKVELKRKTAGVGGAVTKIPKYQNTKSQELEEQL